MPINVPPPVVIGSGSGQPDVTMLGSGTSIPAGLEAVLEYNGLQMNIRSNVDKYRITAIDGLGDPDVRDSRDVNPGDHGETPYGALYGGRTITLNGMIIAHTVYKMRDMQQALKQAFIDISNEYPLIFRVGDPTRDHQISCKKIGSLMMEEAQGNFRAERAFQITLRASNPRILSFESASASSSVGPADEAGRVIFSVQNNGIFPAQPVIALAGPMTWGTLTNIATNESFTISNIPSGMTFTFDIGKKTLRDQTGANQYNNLSDGSDYMHIAPGDPNDIQFAGAGLGSSSSIGMTWQHTWL